MTHYRTALMPLLLGLTLCAQQNSDKPSPVPRKTTRPRPPMAPDNSDARVTGSTAGPRQRAGEPSGPAAHDAYTGPAEETGVACFFSSNANGGLTASGERLSSEELAAGHPRYPLGSRVRVTSLTNGKSVEVRIVDRFPSSSKRVINLSEAAATQLEFVRAGTAQVRLELLQ